MKKSLSRTNLLIFGLFALSFILLNIKFVESVTVGFSTASITSVHTAPLSNTTFVVAYCDDTNDDISFQIYNANGTQLVAETDADTSAGSCAYTSVGVSALNSTHFVIGWYDGGYKFAVYTSDGTLVAGPIDADTDVGVSYSVSVSALNSTHFVIGWFDMTDYDATFAVYTSDGTLITGPTDADTDVGVSYSVSVSALNSTHFVIGWFDDTDDDATFAVYTSDGTLIAGPIDADTDVSNSYSVSVSALNSTHFVIGWYDNMEKDATFAVYNYTGGLITGPIDADDSISTSQSVSVSALNSTHFVVSWYDNIDFDLSYGIYNVSSLGPLAAITDIESWPTASNSPFRYHSPISQETATGIGLCGQSWIIAYANTTTQAAWRSYNDDGTVWDGTCASSDITAPTLTIDQPTNNTDFSTPPMLNGTCTDSGVGIDRIKTNATEYNLLDSTSPFNFTNQSSMTNQGYTVQITCNDTEGNSVSNLVSFTYNACSGSGCDVTSYCTTQDCTPDTQGSYTYITSEGTTYVRFRSNDTAGNLESTDGVSIKIDKSAPTLNIDSPNVSVNHWFNTAPTVSGTCVDSYSGVDSIITNDTKYPLLDSSSPFNFTNQSALTNKLYSIKVTCNDTVNNQNTNTTHFYFDVSLPTITLISPSNDTCDADGSVQFSFNVTDNLAYYFNCSIFYNAALNQTNTTTINATTTSFTINGISGTKLWYIQCNDEAKNTNASETRTINSGTGTITITLNSPTNNTYQKTATTLDLSISIDCGSISAAWYSKNGGATNTTLAAPYDIDTTGWSEGLTYVEVWANDSNGAVTKKTYQFTFDDTAPTTTTNASGINNTWVTYNVNATFTCNDGFGSGCDTTLYCTTQGCTPDTQGSYTYITTEGTNYVRYRSNDSLNNLESIKEVWINIDKTIPLIEFISPTPLNNNETELDSITINVSYVEINLNTTILSWNNANETMTCVSNYCQATKGGLSIGQYVFYVWINDSATNANQTETRTATLYTTPLISDVSTNNTQPYVNETINIRARLKYSNGSLLTGQNMTFRNSTATISSSLTNATGWALVNYVIPPVACSAGHTINVSVDKNSTIYAKYAFNNSLSLTIQGNRTSLSCSIEQNSTVMTLYCVYIDEQTSLNISDGTVDAVVTGGGSQCEGSQTLAYHTSTQRYEFLCSPGECTSVIFTANATSYCHKLATGSSSAAQLSSNLKINVTSTPTSIKPTQIATLTVNVTSLSGTASDVNLSVRVQGYWPYNTTREWHFENATSISSINQGQSVTRTINITSPLYEPTSEYNVTVFAIWNNSVCNYGTNYNSTNVSIINSTEVIITAYLNKYEYSGNDTLYLYANVNNTGNINLSGNVNASIFDLNMTQELGALTCNSTAPLIIVSYTSTLNCTRALNNEFIAGNKTAYFQYYWRETPQNYNYTTLQFKILESIVYGEEEVRMPTAQNVVVVKKPIVVVDRFGNTYITYMDVKTWMEIK